MDARGLSPDVLKRALDARDPRFDGLFFVGITTTMVYCRPVCPARVSHPDRRRFFETAAAAERAGFRPCLRCRPELAPGRALIDSIPRLASQAAHRIAAGALNGHHVADLARELGVSERHLRRALQRELGVTPLELAQTQRLLLAKRLLADTTLSVTRIAYASGFQSLRRFNSVFRARYRMSPTSVRAAASRNGRSPGSERSRPPEDDVVTRTDLVRLTLAYRPPLAWSALTTFLACHALPGVECLDGDRYGRTLELHGTRGVLFVADRTARPAAGKRAAAHLEVEVSAALLPVLMPLLARLRQLLDLDAQPAMVHDVLEQGGLAAMVRACPGLRLPGAIGGFEFALRALLRNGGPRSATGPASPVLQRVVESLGEPLATGHPSLTHLAPTAARIAAADEPRLAALGLSPPRARTLLTLARAVDTGSLRLEPPGDVHATRRALLAIPGLSDTQATRIIMHALHWPDAFPSSDPALQHAAGAPHARALRSLAEAWRPWRGYAAMYLWEADRRSGQVDDVERADGPRVGRSEGPGSGIARTVIRV
jgi:AraC family transcriptional regulator of adaptative response / DNA-3-methyladenine glycosylase II